MSGKRAEQRAAKNRRMTDFLIRQNVRVHAHSPDALAAIERYPSLGSLPSLKYVLRVARNLDALPEADRAEALDKFETQDQDVLAALAEVPPMPGRAERLRADEQLAHLIGVIERHSTPFVLPARLRLV